MKKKTSVVNRIPIGYRVSEKEHHRLKVEAARKNTTIQQLVADSVHAQLDGVDSQTTRYGKQVERYLKKETDPHVRALVLYELGLAED